MQKSEKNLKNTRLPVKHISRLLEEHHAIFSGGSMAYLVLIRKSACNRFTSERMNWMRFSFRSVMKNEGWDLR